MTKKQWKFTKRQLLRSYSTLFLLFGISRSGENVLEYPYLDLEKPYAFQEPGAATSPPRGTLKPVAAYVSIAHVRGRVEVHEVPVHRGQCAGLQRSGRHLDSIQMSRMGAVSGLILGSEASETSRSGNRNTCVGHLGPWTRSARTARGFARHPTRKHDKSILASNRKTEHKDLQTCAKVLSPC